MKNLFRSLFCEKPATPSFCHRTWLDPPLATLCHPVPPCAPLATLCHPATLCDSMPTLPVLRSRRATSMACHIVSALPPVPNPLSPPTHRPHAPQNSDFSNATTKVCARPLATTWLPRSHRAIRTLWQREQWPTTSSRRCTPSRVAATCRRARSLLAATTLSRALCREGSGYPGYRGFG